MYNSQLRACCNAVIRSLILLYRSRIGKRFKVRNCCYTYRYTRFNGSPQIGQF